MQQQNTTTVTIAGRDVPISRITARTLDAICTHLREQRIRRARALLGANLSQLNASALTALTDDPTWTDLGAFWNTLAGMRFTVTRCLVQAGMDEEAAVELLDDAVDADIGKAFQAIQPPKPQNPDQTDGNTAGNPTRPEPKATPNGTGPNEARPVHHGGHIIGVTSESWCGE